MAALTSKRSVRTRKFSSLDLPAVASASYFQGGVVGFDTATGTGLIVKATVTATFVAIGVVAEDKVLGAGGGSITVNLFTEKTLAWFNNATAGDAIAAADVGDLCYWLDDNTVAQNDATNTRSVAGRTWAIDSAKGVLVEPRATNGDRLGGLDA
jgi:hypothetical protein